MVAGISANRETAPTMVIFKGKLTKTEWQSHVPIDWVVKCSENGWILHELMNEYGKMFVRFIKDKRANGYLANDKPVLLLLEGHTTHNLNLEFLELMKQNNVILFAFPPDTSQWLQPLDKTLFTLLRQHGTFLVEFVRQFGRCPNKVEILEMLTKALRKGVT